MNRTAALIAPVLALLAASASRAEDKAEKVVRPAVVRVLATQRVPNVLKPWLKQTPHEVSGSGGVIDGKRILTNAHLSATRAAGYGGDAMKLADEERSGWRQQALDLWRADPAGLTKMVGEGTPQIWRFIARALQHWQNDHNLASLREKAARDKLPLAEREAGQRLWADMNTVLQRAQEK
jgi:hypothetical protein